MQRQLVILFSIIANLILANASNAQPAALPQGIYSFTGIDPSIADDSDLQPIEKIIGNSKIVGLGESVHTSGGYHEVKFRIVRYLVTKMGFRVLALETPRIKALVATEYLSSCTGTPTLTADQALKSVFGVFYSTTTRDMFQWLCHYNQTHKNDPVRFLGFDTQEPNQQVKLIGDFLTQQAPEDAPTLINGLSVCYNFSQPSISDADRANCHGAVSAILKYLNINHDKLIQGSSTETFTLVQLALDGLNAWEDQMFYNLAQNFYLSNAARDPFMAESLEVLRDMWFPNSKAIIWAHNAHLEKAEDQSNGGGQGWKNMGEYLVEKWGNDYAPIGLLSYQTNINWPMNTSQPNCKTVPATPYPYAVEKMLLDLKQPFQIIDLVLMSTLANPFFDPNNVYTYGGGERNKITNEFNGLIYMDHSPAMSSPLWGSCP